MPYTFRAGDLPKLDLDVDRGTDFLAWMKQWNAYRTLSALAAEPAVTQVHALNLCMSRDTLNIMDNLGLTNEQKADQAEIIAGLRRHVEGRINETVERRSLRQRKQQAGETFDTYLVSLRELAKTCNFCNDNCLQKSLRDQVVEGLKDADTVKDLLKQRNLTLDIAITTCQAMEAAKKDVSSIQGTSISATGVNSVMKYKQPRKQSVTATSSTSSTACMGCGKAPHQGGRKNCPAKDAVCRGCNKVGHYHAVCRGGKKPPSQHVDKRTNVPRARMLTIRGATGIHLPRIKVVQETDSAPTLHIHVKTLAGNGMIDILPDSGADICAAGTDFLEQLNEHQANLDPSDIKPRTVNGSTMTPIGSLTAVFSLKNRSVEESVHIYESVSGALISWLVAKNLGILPDRYPEPILDNNIDPTPSINKVNTHVKENIDITREDLINEFPTVFDGPIRTMPGETFKIELTEDYKPFCVNTPRTIPYSYQEKLKAELDLLESQNIIGKQIKPTSNCAPIVIAPKKNSDCIRLCVDLSKLNRYVKRERYQSTTPAMAVADIAKSDAKYFSTFDAYKGYHQCPLDEESQDLTTFITPFGRYKYLRAPYGISSISEHYDRRMDNSLEKIKQLRRIVDDCVVYTKDKEDHIALVRQFLQRCEDKGISLNRDKFQFCQTEITFAGLILSQGGYQISKHITKAIKDFPTSSGRTDLRSFFGLVNQLSGSTNAIAQALAPLRPLLQVKNDYLWNALHEDAFNKAKEILTTAPILAFYDQSRPTRLTTDACRHGLGFVLQQEHQGSWHIVQAGSRFLMDTETRYAVIELEMLSVAWAAQKCRIFLAGLPTFTVITDHSSLVPILNSHRLDEIENPRLQRLRTRLLAYNFIAKWIKGKDNDAADALLSATLSRTHARVQRQRQRCCRRTLSLPSPKAKTTMLPTHSSLPVLEKPGEDIAEYDIDICHSVHTIKCLTTSEIRLLNDPGDNLRLRELRDHAKRDQEYQSLLTLVTQGFPNQKCDLPSDMKKFWGIREHLGYEDDLLVYGCRLFIPVTFRSTVLSLLHEAHQGITRSQDRARLTLYWPGIDADIQQTVEGCKLCQDHLPSHPREPIISKPRPQRPFQEVAMDFAYFAGHNFLITVDCCTDWPEIIQMGKDMTAKKTIEATRNLFCRTAAPDVLWSDGGPQFTSEKFQSFLRDWDVTHKMSTPRYPQSNGKIEATVKSMKKLITAAWTGRSVNQDKLFRALLQYRNTPSRRDGQSPAQKLYGHPIQDTLPAHRRSFAPEWQRHSLDTEESLKISEEYYDQHAHKLPDLHVGSHVTIQNTSSKLWDIYGIITAIAPHRRYFVRTQSGNILVRNRRFLRKRIATSVHAPGPIDIVSQDTVPDTLPAPQRPARQRRPPERLIEDEHWN